MKLMRRRRKRRTGEVEDVNRKHLLTAQDMDTIADAVAREGHDHLLRQRISALYGIYDRRSQVAHDFMRHCRAMDLPSLPVGKFHTIQSLLTRPLRNVLRERFPARLIRLMDSMASRHIKLPPDVRFLRTGLTNTGTVGFVLARDVHEHGERARQILVADLRNNVNLYREANGEPERVNVLPDTDARDQWQLCEALRRAADLANDRPWLITRGWKRSA